MGDDSISFTPPALFYVALDGRVLQVDLDGGPFSDFSLREMEILIGLINHAGNQARSEMRRRSKTSWTPT